MSDLPKGWTSRPLSEVLQTLESGSRPRGGVRGITSGIPSIGGQHLTPDGGFDFEKICYVPEDFADTMKKGRIQKGDILIVKDGATTGKVSYVDENFPFQNAVVNEHVFICRPNPDVASKFLFRFLFSREGQNRILANFRGSAQGGINRQFAPNTQVPIAPLPVQKHIVAKLDKLFAKLQTARQRLDKIPGLLDNARQSILSAACSGELTRDWRDKRELPHPSEDIRHIHENRNRVINARLTNQKHKDVAKPSLGKENKYEIPYNWLRVSVDQISTKVVDGVHKKPDYTKEGIPFIKVKNLTAGPGIDFNNVSYISEADHLTHKQRANPEQNDILVTKDGTLGVIRRISEDKEFGIFVSIALIKLADHSISKYIELMLSSPQVQQTMKATGSGLQHIHLRDLKKAVLPFPCFLEQEEIVLRIEGLFKVLFAIEQRYGNVCSEINNLSDSILTNAFRGAL